MSRLADLIALRARVESDITLELRAVARRAGVTDVINGDRVAVAQRRLAATPAPVVRRWARENGHPVTDRGPLPRLLLDAYVEAHLLEEASRGED